MTLTYKKAGVDISKIKQSQKAIGKLIASTHNLQKKAKMTHGFGHYAGIVEIPGGKLLATHTDGVGTKVVIANMMKKYNTIGIDCVAMNVNDIICIGATPISFVDCRRISSRCKEVINANCRRRNSHNARCDRGKRICI
jgi:phosphoribosylformylglycinamidine cyclo-ligase